MRRLWHSLVLAGLVLCATCSDVDNVVVEADGRAQIPEGGVLEELLGDLDFAGFDDIDITQAQEFENQGYTEDQIDSVRLETVTLTVSTPAGGNFDFLDSIAFFVEAEGEERVEIARLDPVPMGESVVELEVDGSVELRPYVVADAMTVTTEASGTRPEDDTTVDAHLSFDVDVNVSGACSVARR